MAASRLPVELSGLPIFDRARNFAGYRGFGVCRDLDGLARLAALRRYEFFSGRRRAPTRPILSAPDIVAMPELAEDPPLHETPSDIETRLRRQNCLSRSSQRLSRRTDLETPWNSHPTDLEIHAVETPKNVVPFRPPGEPNRRR